jgi:hypothetical protein
VQTLISTAKKHEIKEIVDIELSRDEDSVTSLAVLRSNDNSATVLAGINSSSADQQAGKNEHLRGFNLVYPARRKNDEEKVDNGNGNKAIRALGKTSLFTLSTSAKKETYQRVLRLLHTDQGNGSAIGAVATGLAPAGEVVVFDSTRELLESYSVLKRIQLVKGDEAADLDLIEKPDGGCLIAYCTDYDVFVCDIRQTPTTAEPRLVHGIPHPDASASSPKRPTFRSLRFLTPTLILLLQNLPGRSGSELQLLDISLPTELGIVLLRKVLHTSIKSATALATARLAPITPTQNTQHVIAIAGQDISITILTLELSPSTSSTPLRFRTHTFFRNVHPLQMTALTFSHFHPPSDLETAPLQYLKLASTSMSQTVIVHTFPLIPDPPLSRNKKKAQRYVLQPPGAGEAVQMSFSIIMSIIVVAFGAFLLQAWMEIRGGAPEYLGAKGWLSKGVHDYIALPYMFDDAHTEIPPIFSNLPQARVLKDSAHEKVETLHETAEAIAETVKSKLSLRSLLSQRHGSSPESDEVKEDGTDLPPPVSANPSAILVLPHEQSLHASLHSDDEAASKYGKRWDELDDEQKELWKERLIDAGEWTIGQGEGILQSIFFGQIGGLVGGVVGGLMEGG